MRQVTFAKMFILAIALAIGLMEPSGRAKAAETQDVSVRMDWVTSSYHAPYYVGVKNGYYKEEGLNVTVDPGNGSANVAQAIGHGNGDLATVDGGTMMQLVAKGLPVKAVMGEYERNPNGVIYNKARNIKTPKDLEGKTVALTNGDAPSALLPAFAKAAGVDLSKVTLINTSAAAKNAAVIAGKADADVTFAFQGVPIIRAGGIDAASFDFADYGVTVPGLVLIARDEYIAKNGDTIKRFVRATRKAIEWTMQHPKEAMDILIEMNPGQDVNTTTGLPILEASFQLLHTKNTEGQPIGVMSPKDWATAQDILAEYVGLQKAASPDVYFTNAFTGAQ